MTTRNLVPRGDNQGKIGISTLKWEEINSVTLKVANLQNNDGNLLLINGPGIEDINLDSGQLKIALDDTFLTSLGFSPDGTLPVFTSTEKIAAGDTIVAAINKLDTAAGLVAAPQDIAFLQFADATVIKAGTDVNNDSHNNGSAFNALITSDNKIATAKAIADWVLSKDYSTAAGTITSVTHTDNKGLTALTNSGAVTITTNGILEDLHTLGPAVSDSQFIVATGAGAFQYEKDNVARTSLGLGTGNSPTFTDLTLTGNLIVQGTTTTINTTQLTVEDKAIRLGIPSGMTQQGVATYVLSSNEVTITSANHGLNNGEYVLISDPTGDIPEKVYQITSVADANTFTFAHTAADVGSATAIQHSIANVTDSTANGSGLFVSRADTGETSFKWDSTAGWKISGDSLDLPASKSLSFAGTDILADNAGLMTLSNIDALDATTESTIKSAIDTLSNLTSVGTIGTGVWNAGAVTSSGRIMSDDVTEATSTTDGSIQTDGGLSLVKSAVIGKDLSLPSNAAVINIGTNGEGPVTNQVFTITHIDTTGSGGDNPDNAVLVSSGHKLAFGTKDEYITGDGTDLKLISSGDVAITGGLSSTKATTLASAQGITTIGSTTGATISAAGILNINNATDATNTTNGSIQTDGGLSVALDIFAGNDVKITNDIKLITDGSTINFGEHDDVKLTHVADSGLLLEVNPSSSSVPVFEIRNSSDNGTSAELKFNNTEAAGAGADDDDLGRITFYGQDDNSSNIKFAEILAEVADASNGDECGKISLLVAENDGNNTAGLVVTGSTTDGEVDVTIGAGTASTTTVKGNLVVNNVEVTSRVGSAAKNLSVSNSEVFVKDLPFRVKDANGDTKAEISAAGVGQLVSLSLTGQSAELGMNSQKITSLGTPTADADAATKAYVDSVASGLDIYDSVKAATTASFIMASTASTTTLVLANGEGGFNSAADTFTVDNVSLSQNERVLIKDGVNSNGAGVHNKWNGIYTVGALNGDNLTLTRATDMDADSEINSGAFFFVEQGDTNADGGFVLTTDVAVTIGTTAIEFSQFSGAGQTTAGNGLSKSGNTLSVNVDSTTLEINNDVVRIAAVSAAGSGLSGGADSAIALDLNNLAAGTVAVGADSIAIIDTDGNSEKESISDFIAATAGNGLTAASGVLALDISEFSDEQIASGDKFLMLDSNNSTHQLESIDDIGSYLSSATNSGLSSSSGQLSLDLNDVAADVVDVANDSIVFIDSSKTDSTCDYNDDPTITMDDTSFLSAGMTVTGTGIPNGATIASITDGTTFELSAATTGGAVTNGTLTFGVNATRKETIGDLITAVAGAGLDASSGVLSVTVDNSTIEINSDTVRVKDDGITLAKLAHFSELSVDEGDDGKRIAAVVIGAQSDATTPVEITILDQDNMSGNSATSLATQQSIKAYVDAQVTAQDLDFSSDSGSGAIDLDSETLTISGGTGIDTSVDTANTPNKITIAIDNTVATLTGSQTLTGKTISEDDNDIRNLTTSSIAAATLVIKEDSNNEGIANHDNDTTLPTSAAVKQYVDDQLGRHGGIFKTDSVDNSLGANVEHNRDVIFDSSPLVRSHFGPFAFDLGQLITDPWPGGSDIIFFGSTSTAASDRHFLVIGSTVENVHEKGECLFTGASFVAGNDQLQTP